MNRPSVPGAEGRPRRTPGEVAGRFARRVLGTIVALGGFVGLVLVLGATDASAHEITKIIHQGSESTASSTSAAETTVEATDDGGTPGSTCPATNPFGNPTNGNCFIPGEVTIQEGDTVVWENTGDAPHTSTSDDGVWDSETMEPGDSFSHTFTQTGTFNYHCKFHGGEGGEGQAGRVIVEESEGGGTSPTPTPAATPTPSPTEDDDGTEADGTDDTDAQALGAGSDFPQTGAQVGTGDEGGEGASLPRSGPTATGTVAAGLVLVLPGAAMLARERTRRRRS